MMHSNNRKVLNALMVKSMALMVLLGVVHLSAHLYITEMYRDHPGNESSPAAGASHEFVEIANIGMDTILLASVYITNGIEADSVIPVNEPIPGHADGNYGSTMLAPGSIALILDADYRDWCVNNTTDRLPIAPGTVLFETGDKEFGSSGLASHHGVALYRGTKSRIDSLLCQASDAGVTVANSTGQTITLSEPENIEGFSVCLQKKLFGKQRYGVTPDSMDPGVAPGLVDGWYVESRLLQQGADTSIYQCSLQVQQCGGTAFSAVDVQIESCVATHCTTLVTTNVQLDHGYGMALVPLPARFLPYKVRLSSAVWNIEHGDLRLPGHALSITEIFPRAAADEPEWFEIFNTSPIAVDLATIRIASSEDTSELTSIPRRIAPGTFTVVGRNSEMLMAKYRYLRPVCVPPRWIGFDNSSDTLSLLDAEGMVIETVCYDAATFPTWPTVSIVRIDDSPASSASWVVAERSTPGMPSFEKIADVIADPGLDIGPIPFTPDNDGRDDVLAIRLAGTGQKKVTIRIYGIDGHILKSIEHMSGTVFYWDGKANRGFAPPGPFFVVVEMEGDKKQYRLRKKGLLWRR